MSKKERYYILDSPNTMPFICDRFDNDKTIAEVHSDNVNQLCDLLNEQDKQLQPFIELAKKHDKTIDELYQFMRSYLNSRNENTYWMPKNYRW